MSRCAVICEQRELEGAKHTPHRLEYKYFNTYTSINCINYSACELRHVRFGMYTPMYILKVLIKMWALICTLQYVHIIMSAQICMFRVILNDMLASIYTFWYPHLDVNALISTLSSLCTLVCTLWYRRVHIDGHASLCSLLCTFWFDAHKLETLIKVLCVLMLALPILPLRTSGADGLTLIWVLTRWSRPDFLELRWRATTLAKLDMSLTPEQEQTT